jgi:hypothetical protein
MDYGKRMKKDFPEKRKRLGETVLWLLLSVYNFVSKKKE